MSKISMNLNKFKHLKSTESATTLQHPEGHILTIAHKSLSPEGQEQLKALSKISSQDATPQQADEAKHQNMAKGGKVAKFCQYCGSMSHGGECMAEGGEVKHLEENTLDYSKMKKPKPDGGKLDYTGFAKTTQNKNKQLDIENRSKPRKMYADPDAPVSQDDSAPVLNDEQTIPKPEHISQEEWDKTPPQLKLSTVDPMLAEKVAPATPTSFFKPVGDFIDKLGKNQDSREANELKSAGYENDPRNDEQATTSQALPQTSAPTEVSSGTPDQPRTLAQAPPVSQGVPLTTEGMFNSGMSQGEKSIQGSQQAAQDLSAATQQLQQQKASALDTAERTYKEQQASSEDEYKNFVHDVRDGYVSPEKYWTGTKNPNTGEIEGSHSKVMSAIGMILAGFNPTSNPNAAIKMFQYQMDKNLESQQKRLDSTHNLIKANLDHYKNIKDAYDTSKLQIGAYYDSKLAEEAAKQGTPQALANAQKARQELYLSLIPTKQQLDMRRTLMSLSNGGGQSASQPGMPQPGALKAALGTLDAVAPEQAKQYRERLVDNVHPNGAEALADRPLSPDDRKELEGKNEFDRLAKQYNDFATKNSGVILDAKTSPAQKMAILNQGAVLGASLQNAYRNSTHGGVYKEGEQDMIRKIIPDNPAQVGAKFRTNPRIDQLIKTNNDNMNSIKKTYGLPVHNDTPQIKIYNGVKYMRGPNGEAVPVK